jgi:hypothetical protein
VNVVDGRLAAELPWLHGPRGWDEETLGVLADDGDLGLEDGDDEPEIAGVLGAGGRRPEAVRPPAVEASHRRPFVTASPTSSSALRNDEGMEDTDAVL